MRESLAPPPDVMIVDDDPHIRQLLAFASSVMTLEAGDLLLTGTPAGVGPLLPGDVVDVTIEGLGVLRNPVAAEITR